MRAHSRFRESDRDVWGRDLIDVAPPRERSVICSCFFVKCSVLRLDDAAALLESGSSSLRPQQRCHLRRCKSATTTSREDGGESSPSDCYPGDPRADRAAQITSTIYNVFIKRNAVFVTTIFTGAFAFGVGYDLATTAWWDAHNRGVRSAGSRSEAGARADAFSTSSILTICRSNGTTSGARSPRTREGREGRTD